MCVAGFTDSHWLRDAFGTVAYGFFPLRTMPAEVAAALIHSADERVPVDDLELGVDWLRHAARTVCVTVELGRSPSWSTALAAEGFDGRRASSSRYGACAPSGAGAVPAPARRVLARARPQPARGSFAVGEWSAPGASASTRTRSRPCAPRSSRATSTR